jgi:hypothetical protein
MLLVGLLAVAVIAVAAVRLTRGSDARLYAAALRDDDAVVRDASLSDSRNRVYRRRILRSQIPVLNYRNIAYRQLFNDSNYVQLSAARANGIDPQKVGDPASNDALVPIFSTPLYRVDTMYHSEPYLMPEAVLLLDYIAHRFKTLMAENYPSVGEHNIIVTSALRTDQSEARLRRVNRNATDTSCHIYGTTFDISAQRYLHLASGHDTVVDACKQMLALALYQLRYEGLCYVKYERGSCFHITLRTTQYEGTDSSETRSYVNPGSPDYLLTKAPPRPKPQQSMSKPYTAKGKATPAWMSKPSGGSKTSSPAKNRQHKKESEFVVEPHNRLTDRERISMERFE